MRARLLAHDLPVGVLHEVALGHAARRLRLGAAEDNGPRPLPLRDRRHAIVTSSGA